MLQFDSLEHKVGDRVVVVSYHKKSVTTIQKLTPTGIVSVAAYRRLTFNRQGRERGRRSGFDSPFLLAAEGKDLAEAERRDRLEFVNAFKFEDLDDEKLARAANFLRLLTSPESKDMTKLADEEE